MRLPTLISRTSSFPILRVLGGIFYYTTCKQAVETLIRHRVLWRLIWVCSVCLCTTKKTICLYGLNTHVLKQCNLYNSNFDRSNSWFIRTKFGISHFQSRLSDTFKFVCVKVNTVKYCFIAGIRHIGLFLF